MKNVVSAFIFLIKNFNVIKNNIYNLGISTGNSTKLSLAKKIKKNNTKRKSILEIPEYVKKKNN